MMKALITSRVAWILGIAYGAHYLGTLIINQLDGVSSAINF